MEDSCRVESCVLGLLRLYLARDGFSVFGDTGVGGFMQGRKLHAGVAEVIPSSGGTESSSVVHVHVCACVHVFISMHVAISVFA